MKVFTEHFIIDEQTFKKSQTNNEKNEEENFQLLYYLSYMIKSGIGGFPNP